MVRGMAAAAAVVVMLAAGAAQAAAPAAPVVVPPSCDRACLEGFIDKYLAALAAKDPRDCRWSAARATPRTARS